MEIQLKSLLASTLTFPHGYSGGDFTAITRFIQQAMPRAHAKGKLAVERRPFQSYIFLGFTYKTPCSDGVEEGDARFVGDEKDIGDGVQKWREPSASVNEVKRDCWRLEAHWRRPGEEGARSTMLPLGACPALAARMVVKITNPVSLLLSPTTTFVLIPRLLLRTSPPPGSSSFTTPAILPDSGILTQVFAIEVDGLSSAILTAPRQSRGLLGDSAEDKLTEIGAPSSTFFRPYSLVLGAIR
ncbi:hypothetical protein DFH09DRAFT_1104640 [Mycena vulgaris]|nr:hypothetical protein DFH09DRAFT_1104640 [Mycena vulgaris]